MHSGGSARTPQRIELSMSPVGSGFTTNVSGFPASREPNGFAVIPRHNKCSPDRSSQNVVHDLADDRLARIR